MKCNVYTLSVHFAITWALSRPNVSGWYVGLLSCHTANARKQQRLSSQGNIGSLAHWSVSHIQHCKQCVQNNDCNLRVKLPWCITRSSRTDSVIQWSLSVYSMKQLVFMIISEHAVLFWWQDHYPDIWLSKRHAWIMCFTINDGIYFVYHASTSNKLFHDWANSQCNVTCL